jgi:hypothetical protein
MSATSISALFHAVNGMVLNVLGPVFRWYFVPEQGRSGLRVCADLPRYYGTELPRTVPGRASVPASPNFSPFPMLFGLAGTLALPPGHPGSFALAFLHLFPPHWAVRT